MRNDLLTYLEELKERGLPPEREARMRAELATESDGHSLPLDAVTANVEMARFGRSIYADGDLLILRQAVTPHLGSAGLAKSLDELLERDRQREQDGFPRKIQVGKLVKPGRGRKGKIVVVPTTVEEKLFHDPTVHPPGEGGASGGTGEGEEGEVIGEQPVREEGGEPGSGPGQGEGDGEGDGQRGGSIVVDGDRVHG